MKVKRFEAHDTKAALALIKEELGEDAVILATRTLGAPPKNGLQKDGKPLVEVVAAVDFDLDALPVSAAPRPLKPAREKPAADHGRPALANGDNKGKTQKIPPRQGQEAAAASGRPAGLDSGAFRDKESLNLELRGPRPRFADLLKRQGGQVPAAPNGQGPETAAARRDAHGRPRPEDVAQWRHQVIEQLRVKPLALKKNSGPTIIALVGPTGVGKTTTAAKIAAWYTLHEEYRVALLSMDCYRIGATDQLRTYAKIMRLPCEIALRQRDLQWALAKHRDRDLIIIDTAGKSPFDPDHVPELGQWFAPHHDIEPYLVVNATSKKEDLRHILQTYGPLDVSGLIMTKLDETRAYAALCQQAAASALPIACLCMGQRVPEDFLPASKDFLHSLFGKGWDNAMMKREALAGQTAWLQ